MVADARLSIEMDLSGPEFFADPYPVYERLRQNHPVYWSDLWGCWLVTRYDDIVHALRDHEHFSNVGRQTAMLAKLGPELQAEIQPLSSHYTAGGMSNQDPPDHSRLRGLVNIAFTPREVAALKPKIQETVNALAARMTPDVEIDFVEQFAKPLPALVIADLLGLPEQDRGKLMNWSNEITAFLGNADVDAVSAGGAQEAMTSLRGYLGELIRQRQAQPKDDLLGKLGSAHYDGESLSENEMIGTCVTLLMGGHETTMNLLANGLLALLRNPEQMNTLRRNPALMPLAIEEFLRFDAPVQRIWRLVREDTSIAGQNLRKGESVFLMVGAASRDGSHFIYPDRLDISRQPNRHLTFGLGIHFCLGAALARLEAEVAFSSVLRSFEEVQLGSSPIRYRPNVAFRGVEALPVLLSGTGKGERPIAVY